MKRWNEECLRFRAMADLFVAEADMQLALIGGPDGDWPAGKRTHAYSVAERRRVDASKRCVEFKAYSGGEYFKAHLKSERVTMKRPTRKQYLFSRVKADFVVAIADHEEAKARLIALMTKHPKLLEIITAFFENPHIKL